ncbi:hypothetical protein OHA72_14320 [Dactylosporangium sp. NBC_01737]|uniref:hypothetical protein n=1 Tax=Dactylosporangium sp. NBC_01737 TaxID=2975959 RepID=UPI002E0DD0FE|nr:hypothetical protein OHA72_14320 [Dactylosporangium sp. NBC_01737]
MRRLTRPAAGAVPVRSIAAAGVPAADRFATLLGVAIAAEPPAKERTVCAA